ncbi:hypothetical protein D9M71_734600 [compost metagenome]
MTSPRPWRKRSLSIFFLVALSHRRQPSGLNSSPRTMVPSWNTPNSSLKSTSSRPASSNSLFSTSLTLSDRAFIFASCSAVPQPKATTWDSLMNGSPFSSFLRNSSKVEGSSLMPSSTPRRFTRLPAA